LLSATSPLESLLLLAVIEAVKFMLNGLAVTANSVKVYMRSLLPSSLTELGERANVITAMGVELAANHVVADTGIVGVPSWCAGCWITETHAIQL
jgi:hypothetical protein